jgi:hypothetical protein
MQLVLPLYESTSDGKSSSEQLHVEVDFKGSDDGIG